jgi:hypothetical protein
MRGHRTPGGIHAPRGRRAPSRRPTLRRGAALLGACAVASLAVLLAAGPAGAEFDRNDAQCEARAVFEKAGAHDATESKVTLPLSDTVQWKASVKGGGNEDGLGPRRVIEGHIKLKTPFGDISVEDLGTWGPKEDRRYANSGTYDYSLPSIAGGATLTLSGQHSDGGQVCSGSVTIELEDGGFSNPALWGSLVFTAVTATGFAVALRV